MNTDSKPPAESGIVEPTQLPNFWLAIVPVVILLASLWWVVGLKGGDPRPPLLAGTVAACLIGRVFLRIRWKQMEEGMIKGIKVALPAILILMVIGILIGL